MPKIFRGFTRAWRPPRAESCGKPRSIAALAILLLFGAAPTEATAGPKQVLVLQSFFRGNLSLDSFTANLHVELNQRAGEPVNVVQVVVVPVGSVGAPEQTVVDYIRSIFTAGRSPDLIVTVAGPAAVFAHKYRQQIFPDTPLLFGSVDQRYLRTVPLGDNEAAVPVVNEFAQLVEDITQVLPETRHVFVVAGSGQAGRFWRREMEIDFRRFQDRLTFEWSDGLSLSDILRRGASLPPGSAILYLNLDTDSQGGAYADERVLADLHATANAPLFGKHDVMLGHGIVGGRLLGIEVLARTTAAAAIRILNGVPAGSIRPPPQLPGGPMFDWRELQRWKIPDSRLPAGAVVRHRIPNAWETHRFTILGVAGALAVQSVLILALLYQRRGRRKAEIDSHRSLALAADANRRVTMSALTSSIAHELGQPLSAMIQNAEALQIMVCTNGATADTMQEILSDIQTQGFQATQIIDRHRTMLRGHRLNTRPIDLHAVIQESLALLAHDRRARRIEVSSDLCVGPCVVLGDPVLLQQVLVNLMVNAMDAMAATPPHRRQLRITTVIRGPDVEISVRDHGPGLPAEVLDRMFMPFVTTKSQGLGIGLTIARNIVDAHGGAITAQNAADGGAIMTIRLRRAEAPTRMVATASAA